MFDTLRCMYQISESSNMSEGTETTAKVIARLQNDWRREVGAILALVFYTFLPCLVGKQSRGEGCEGQFG